MTVEGVRENPDAAFAAKEYIQVLVYLERIGDYAVIFVNGLSTSSLENH